MSSTKSASQSAINPFMSPSFRRSRASPTISTFSCDIAYAVSRGGDGRGWFSSELDAKRCEETSPGDAAVVVPELDGDDASGESLRDVEVVGAEVAQLIEVDLAAVGERRRDHRRHSVVSIGAPTA